MDSSPGGEQPPKASVMKAVWNSICLFTVLTAALLPAIAAAVRGEVNKLPELIGFALGSLLIPATIAAVICRKNRTRFPKVLFYSFFICFALTSASRSRLTEPPEGTDKHIGGILNEVMSSKPASTASTQPYDAALRETFRKMLAVKKKYETETENIDVSGVYDPKSFSSNAAMQKRLDDGRVLNAADRTMLEAWESMPKEFQAQINASSLSSTDKQAVLHGFEEKFHTGSLLPRLRTSVEWSASLCDFYDFALQHSSSIHVRGEQITIGDEAVRDKFNKKLEDSMALLQKVQALDRAVEAEKEQTVKRFGLTETK